MQAITTKYISPTNASGTRVSASCEAGRISIAWDDELNTEDNHRAAAAALIAKLQWGGQWVGGGIKGAGYAFVHCETPVRIDTGVQG